MKNTDWTTSSYNEAIDITIRGCDMGIYYCNLLQAIYTLVRCRYERRFMKRISVEQTIQSAIQITLFVAGADRRVVGGGLL